MSDNPQDQAWYIQLLALHPNSDWELKPAQGDELESDVQVVDFLLCMGGATFYLTGEEALDLVRWWPQNQKEST